MSEKPGEQRMPIPLSEWIRSFQTFLMTVSSADYLMNTLRLAFSLADEICKVKDETGRSPTPSVDWMDSIVVHVKSNSKEDNTEIVVDTILTGDGDIRDYSHW